MKIIYIVFAILIILALFETWMYVLTHHPNILRKFSRRLQNSMGYLYILGDRKVMQFLEGCGRYHPELGYTLKPGTFTFSEIEFSNEYNINSLGVRDAEESLNAPEIVFLGDSFALGWGVDQKETFVKLLEDKMKLKTLNTSVPSFGTVREMLMLRKVDRSRLKYLIIQYCADDYDENRLYHKNGNRPQIMRAETFQNITTKYSKPKSYYPGKYIGMKIRKKSGEWILKPPKSDGDHSLSDVDLFLHVLKQNMDILMDIPLIVFELSGINQTNTFTKSLMEKTAGSAEPPFIRNMIILDMTQYLEDRHYYVLDGHLNTAGHVVVTDMLYKTIKDFQGTH
ncbi:MAG: hypothetical protein ACYDGO_07645 [Smithellaceae bacterium]